MKESRSIRKLLVSIFLAPEPLLDKRAFYRWLKLLSFGHFSLKKYWLFSIYDIFPKKIGTKVRIFWISFLNWNRPKTPENHGFRPFQVKIRIFPKIPKRDPEVRKFFGHHFWAGIGLKLRKITVLGHFNIGLVCGHFKDFCQNSEKGTQRSENFLNIISELE